ncbi:hypothetical protein, partial [Streptomyces althioticus]|uniref:hypothetical protein n=1 Tax=Streptomyces althioticus TaxID=83380 RepID=UPI0036FB68F3
SDGWPTSASVTLLLVIDASSMIGSYTERFTVPPGFVRTYETTLSGPASSRCFRTNLLDGVGGGEITAR